MPLSYNLRRKGVKEKAALRRQQALDLRIGGKTYRAIGAALGVSEKVAHCDVHSALKRLADLEDDKARELRALDLERLDRAIEALQPKIEKGNIRAVATLPKLLERRSKMLGLDAPARKQLGGDPNAPLNATTVVNGVYVDASNGQSEEKTIALTDLPPALVMSIVHIMREKGATAIDLSAPPTVDLPALDSHIDDPLAIELARFG